ncbi:hypothetical protein BVY04_04530 [bacterium M21]|nr:hypothetical protein BVY04_04530 [bacterium M21]
MSLLGQRPAIQSKFDSQAAHVERSTVEKMCHYITMVVPSKTSLSECEAVLSDFHRSIEQLGNIHVEKTLKSGEIYFHPAGKDCDCGTALGSLRRGDEGRVDKATLDGFRKKGWSETKIARWLAERDKVRSREQRIQAQREVTALERANDPDGWCSIIGALQETLGLKYVGIMLHWYGGGMSSEKIEFTRCNVPLDEKLGNALYHMEEDTLYVVQK